VLPGHGGGFDFEEQVGAADVADDGYPGPGELVFDRVKYLFDRGRLAVGDHLHHVVVVALHFAQDRADVFYRRIDLTCGVADVRGRSGGVDGGGPGNEHGFPSRHDAPSGP